MVLSREIMTLFSSDKETYIILSKEVIISCNKWQTDKYNFTGTMCGNWQKDRDKYDFVPWTYDDINMSERRLWF